MSIDRYPKERDSVGKSIVFTYFFSVLSAITGFLIVVIFSWLLSPEEWGAFTVAKRTGTLIATIAVLGIPVAISRYIPMERARRSVHASYYGSNAVYIVVISTLSAAIVWLLGLSVIPRSFLGDGALLLPLFAATLFFGALIWQYFLTSFLRAEGYIRRYNLMILTGQLLQLVFGCAAIVFFGRVATYAIAGASVGIFGVVLISFLLLRNLGILLFRKEYLKRGIQREIISYGLPRMGMGILDILLLGFSMLLLGFTGNTFEAGLFAIALQFVAIIVLIFQPIAIVMLPEFSKLHGMEDSENIENKIQVLIQGWLYIILFILIMVLVFIEPVFRYIFKADYIDAMDYIKILLVGIIPFSFYLTTYSYINAVLKKPVVLYFMLFGLLVNIGVFVLLVPRFGGDGAAIATTAGMMAVGICMVVLLLKFQSRAFHATSMFDLVICFIPLAGLLTASLFITHIVILLAVTGLFVSTYVYLLKKRKVSWFAIIENNYLRKKVPINDLI